MKKLKTKLKINENEVVVGHEFLEMIIRDIPDIPDNKKIFEILSHSNNKLVRWKIAERKCLSKKTINILLNDNSNQVIACLLSNKNINKKLTKKSVMKIIKKGDTKPLCAIARHIGEFSLLDNCKVAKILSKHQDPHVRFCLVEWCNKAVPTSVLRRLSKDKDVNISLRAKSKLNKRLKIDSKPECTGEICFCDF